MLNKYKDDFELQATLIVGMVLGDIGDSRISDTALEAIRDKLAEYIKSSYVLGYVDGEWDNEIKNSLPY